MDLDVEIEGGRRQFLRNKKKRVNVVLGPKPEIPLVMNPLIVESTKHLIKIEEKDLLEEICKRRGRRN